MCGRFCCFGNVGTSESGLDINLATAEQLEHLPGIGVKRAQAIVAYRAIHGSFATIDALAVVPGIGPATVANLEGLAHCTGSSATQDSQGLGALQCGRIASMFLWCCQGLVALPHRIHTPLKTSGGKFESIFFPDKEGKGLARILHVLGAAHRRLDVAMYEISQAQLAGALEAVHRRGIAVRVLTDDEQAKDDGSFVPRLRRAGIPVRTDASKTFLMHHKFAVVDDSVVLSGSLNWTEGAVHGNNENVVLSFDRVLAGQFATEFSRLWEVISTGHPGKAPSTVAFGGRATALFFPDSEGTNVAAIRKELVAARKTIDLAMFTLTSDELVGTLLAQHRDGVRVRIIVDKRQASCKGSDVERLRDAGVSVRMHATASAMHHKFVVIDVGTLVNGSFNWTAKAAGGNQENTVIYRRVGDALAASFVAEFERMWLRDRPK